MIIVTVENICKSYGEKTLFKDVSFTISDEDKIGLIGVNGTGKSSLLKIVTGEDSPDGGTITIPKGATIEYLDQNPDLDPNATILEQVFKGNSKIMSVIGEYEKALDLISKNPEDEKLQNHLLALTSEMDSLDAWDLESKIKTVLTKLNVTDFDKKIKELSGGQKKRVALCSALISPCDLLVLDEPTNHMDNDTIDWLENYLQTRKGALLMVTHDRYFLDRVVNKTLELDYGTMYTYNCNYSQFVEKKAERKALENSLEEKRQSLYKKELEWIRAGVQARGTKQKARIKRFEELEESSFNHNSNDIDISVAHSRLGKKIINIENLTKKFEEKTLIKDFNYILLRNDRIGIVGSNGMGKSTLLNIITNKINSDSGSIDIGTTVNIAYFSQHSEDMDPNLRAIEYIRETAEFITTADGTKISASQMMERFLFTDDMQWCYISKLSGGEKRRLYLLKILMTAPNVLILDEPTNDLDIDTLKVLENYIDEFNGPVISVSHDRYFLDRTCNKILHFEGNGKISEYIGNYSDFIYRKKEISNITSKEEKTNKALKENNSQKEKTSKLKFSYKEKLEYENIDKEIEKLEEKLSKLEEEVEINASDFMRLEDLLKDKDKVEEELLFKMERQEYLENLAKEIEENKKTV
ncbi:ABC transporter ATP-binding protein [Clostridium botulinum]|nr:ABC transporter ATP-binding protein [Clostridium botulinum]NFD34222.1 ABC transporter ATP-binding protein [Clostridium botulinum]NFD55809.1 ABC transporter ATP-binding protein [Clostridium botulinum]NFD59492.1 ABC transporter ATP-binding protein [Clostridium botulinum]NFE01566.1 ABC transporter ATP-binding protein [Clostridium botulinum]